METKGIRLNKILCNLNISLQEAVSVLKARTDLGFFESDPSFRISPEQLDALMEYVINKISNTNNSNTKNISKIKKESVPINQPKTLTTVTEDIESNNINPNTNDEKRKIDYVSQDDNHKNINYNTDDISDNSNGIRNKQNIQYKFRHKKPKIIKTKGNGSLILSISPYCFNYNKNSIKFKYNNNELYFSANGISAVLNQNISEITKKFPSVRIEVINKRNFRFTNPKFYNYITDLCEKINNETKEAKHLDKEIKLLSKDKGTEKTTDSSNDSTKETIKEQPLQAENLEFFDYYYKVWVIDSNKDKCRNLSPYVIRDNNSRACFNILNKYLSNRMPNNIKIKYSKENVIAVDKSLMIAAYIRILQNNILIRGDWEYELSNYRKRTLNSCINIPKKNVTKDITYKNIYIDYLASNQSSKQIIKVYEVFNGIEEDCFIFTIKMKEDLSAIIFENVSSEARASEIFIVKERDYIKCINLIFNYFTDYELKQKRLAIKRKQIDAKNFCAIKYETVDHDKLATWINNIKNIINNAEKVQPQNIQFVEGLRISQNTDTRIFQNRTTKASHKHNELMEKLYSKLIEIYGKENVGTEIHVGMKRIDLAVRHDNEYDIYEIKTDNDVRTCIRQAIGQIFDYAYFECSNKIRNMVIVGPTPVTNEADKYLAKMRDLHKINIYYESIL